VALAALRRQPAETSQVGDNGEGREGKGQSLSRRFSNLVRSGRRIIPQALRSKPLSEHVYTLFPALAIPNYRLFIAGQGTSLIGTWMQAPVLQWVVYDLSRKAGDIVMTSKVQAHVNFLGQLPMTVLVIIAGVAADRYSRQGIITITQTWLMLVASVLGILAVTGSLSIPAVYVCAALSGIAQAFDTPARQAFMVEVAGRKALGSAIALNSAMFNTARVVGPTIGTAVLAMVGVAACFFINAASFLAIIAALVAIRGLHPRPMLRSSRGLKDFMDGLRYVAAHGDIRIVLVLTGAWSLFGTYFATLAPLFVGDVYGKGGKEYGILVSLLGAGALVGALVMACTTRRAKQQHFTVGGMAVMCAALFALAFNTNYYVACALYVVHGFGMICFLIAGNILVQHLSAPEYQGRTMGARHFVFGGMWTFGSLVAGYLPKYIGLSWTVASGVIVMAAALVACAPRVLRIDMSALVAEGPRGAE